MSRVRAQTIIDESARLAVGAAQQRRLARGTGRERVDPARLDNAQLQVTEREAAVQRLVALLGAEEAAKQLGASRVFLGDLKRAAHELEAVPAGFGSELKRFINSSTPLPLLRAASQRREATARAAAQRLADDPGAAHDAGNNALQAHLFANDPEVRARILTDTMLQFRATRRSPEMIDRAGGEYRDNSEGRLPTSAPLSVLEQQLAAQQAPKGDSFESRRERTLLRLCIANHPHGSTGSIYEARNLTIELLGPVNDRFLGKPFNSVYAAVHALYTSNTPATVEAYLRQHVFSGGTHENWTDVFGACVEALEAPTPEAAQQILRAMAARTGVSVPGAAKDVRASVLAFLHQHGNLRTVNGRSPEQQIAVYSKLHRLHAAICRTAPSPRTLVRDLGFAGEAKHAVAALVLALRAGDDDAALEAAGRARTDLAAAIAKTPSGALRQAIWRLDRDVEALHTQLLGSAVRRGKQGRDDAAFLALARAARSATRAAVASGLDTLGGKPSLLQDLTAELDAALEKPSIPRLREVLGRLVLATHETCDAIQAWFGDRASAIHFDGIDCELREPADALIKEGPLHALLALSQTGAGYGLSLDVQDGTLRLSGAMHVLSAAGPTVYRRVVMAKDMKELRAQNPSPDDLCVVASLDASDRMALVGGLAIDADDAQPGLSHLVVFARNHAIGLFAIPGARKQIERLLGDDGSGIYVDDRGGELVLMRTSQAVAAGIVPEAEIERLRPGKNTRTEYVDLDGRIASTHLQERNPARPTVDVRLYLPDLTNRHDLPPVVDFAAFGTLPLDARRHLGGEKAAVLAELEASRELKKLGVKLAPSALLPTFTTRDLLERAGVLAEWRAEAAKSSADRETASKRLRALTVRRLEKLLLAGGRPTALGRELCERMQKAGVQKALLRIARSSMVTEDRPFKSGAGQYTSVPRLKGDAALLQAVSQVIASTWNPEAVDQNVRSEIDLAQVWPAVLVQRCLKPELSGVAASRDPRGELGFVHYQAVPGAESGVHAKQKRTEEGTLGPRQQLELERLVPGKKESLLTPKQQSQLRSAILCIERTFNRSIEPGKRYAVECEWALEGGQLYILQARVFTG